MRNTTDIPILFISARTSDDDVLLGLNVGGDDYIQKPYSLNILLAKVRAVLKRDAGDTRIYSILGVFKIDFIMEKLMNDDKEIRLKAMEYKLLAYLIQNRNRNISKE